MKNNRVQVYSTNEPVKAEMIRQLLNNHDIEAFTLNKRDSSYHFGEIVILVDQDSLIKSKSIIEDFLKDE